MNYCKDCKWFSRLGDEDHIARYYSYCRHPASAYTFEDPVTGLDPRWTHCYDMRQPVSGACKLDGVLFEPKESE